MRERGQIVEPSQSTDRSGHHSYGRTRLKRRITAANTPQPNRGAFRPAFFLPLIKAIRPRSALEIVRPHGRGKRENPNERGYQTGGKCPHVPRNRNGCERAGCRLSGALPRTRHTDSGSKAPQKGNDFDLDHRQLQMALRRSDEIGFPLLWAPAAIRPALLRYA